MKSKLSLVAMGFLLVTSQAPGATAAADGLSIDYINSASFENSTSADAQPDPMILKLQVRLDQLNYSVGVIDGYDGDNLRKAIRAFQTTNGMPSDGEPTAQVWEKLEKLTNNSKVIEAYSLTEVDAAKPAIDTIPDDYAEMAKLDSLAYTSRAERLAEMFQMDIDLFERLNKNKDISKHGTEVLVAATGNNAVAGSVNRIEVSKANGSLSGYGGNNQLLVHYPATVGSRQTPSPSGTVEVRAVAIDPTYSYNPDINFTQGNNTEPLTLPPGPNGPVGNVWIDLSKPTYGIHGTPDPSKIDKDQSHGCVRLTNWDAKQLAQLVSPGTIVEFVE